MGSYGAKRPLDGVEHEEHEDSANPAGRYLGFGRDLDDYVPSKRVRLDEPNSGQDASDLARPFVSSNLEAVVEQPGVEREVRVPNSTIGDFEVSAQERGRPPLSAQLHVLQHSDDHQQANEPHGQHGQLFRTNGQSNQQLPAQAPTRPTNGSTTYYSPLQTQHPGMMQDPQQNGYADLVRGGRTGPTNGFAVSHAASINEYTTAEGLRARFDAPRQTVRGTLSIGSTSPHTVRSRGLAREAKQNGDASNAFSGDPNTGAGESDQFVSDAGTGHPEASVSDDVNGGQAPAPDFNRPFTRFDRYPLYPYTSFDLGPRSDLRDNEVPDDVKELMMRKKDPTVVKKNSGRRDWRPKKKAESHPSSLPEAVDNGEDAMVNDWIDFSKAA